MNYWVNLVIILMIVGFVMMLVPFRLLQQKNNRIVFNSDNEREKFTFDAIQNFIKSRITEITTSNLYNENLTEAEFKRRSNRRQELKDALKNCNTGDLSSKIYVREYIYDLLLDEYEFDEEKVNWTIPFDLPNQMTAREKFETLLYVFSKKYGNKALGVIIDTYQLAKPKADGGYRILEEEISTIFKEVTNKRKLTFEDKLRVITQIVYSQYKGFGIIDEIRDMSIDGVSGGVSGIGKHRMTYNSDEDVLNQLREKGRITMNSAWIMYKGKNIHLSFLSFEHEAELRRVVTNLYKYGYPGQLSESRPYIVNEMFDESRIVVFRPKLSESWAFFNRKKYDSESLTLEELIPQQNNYLPITLLKFLMRGNRTCAITGPQGSGKTTLLMAMVGHIRRTLNIRVQETMFEANLRSLYPNHNILSFQETDTVSGQEGLDLQKKTDGDVSIIGEVATAPVAAWMVQAAQVASLFTLFTHHGKTLSDLVYDLRNSLLKAGNFSNETIAEQQVVKVLEFDIHPEKMRGDDNEERFIERITECVPITYEDESISMESIQNAKNKDDKLTALIDVASRYFLQKTQKKQFIERPILEFRDGQYVAVNSISLERQQSIMKNLTSKEKEEFKQFIKTYWGE